MYSLFLRQAVIHAIGKGILLAEIQQTSDATLRIYDFDRVDDKGKPRSCIPKKPWKPLILRFILTIRPTIQRVPISPTMLASCKYFTTNYF